MSEQQPLLESAHHELKPPKTFSHWLNPATKYVGGTRHQVQRFLTSKYGHYSVLVLVTLDVSCIFAGTARLLSFVTLNWSRRNPQISYLKHELSHIGKGFEDALNVLGIVSLVFSCLFMVELLASIWAFGKDYLRSWFHIFDAVVIIVGFVVDVLLHGVLEEIASLVVVLRLWRVFKIIEELSAGAQEQMEGLEERVEVLEDEKRNLEMRIRELERRS
ncbi:hypothetical protein NA57DRAFT_74149 [Rhizodiscina lignyota]|uniref:Voltage-gated hydrogen channel 1 n=1 Tax=Rhizodiscina lignyota TaxID=1504668 RepID=A0A9P4M7K9_9PEZI|nr:hypothetical protein NA57DRAFT_74149 [Rhizodiscina lignyota]